VLIVIAIVSAAFVTAAAGRVCGDRGELGPKVRARDDWRRKSSVLRACALSLGTSSQLRCCACCSVCRWRSCSPAPPCAGQRMVPTIDTAAARTAASDRQHRLPSRHSAGETAGARWSCSGVEASRSRRWLSLIAQTFGGCPSSCESRNLPFAWKKARVLLRSVRKVGV
jgi:hypothetical protein